MSMWYETKDGYSWGDIIATFFYLQMPLHHIADLKNDLLLLLFLHYKFHKIKKPFLCHSPL